MNIGTVLKAMLGKLLGDRVEHIIMGFSKCIDTILNRTELVLCETAAVSVHSVYTIRYVGCIILYCVCFTVTCQVLVCGHCHVTVHHFLLKP